jgi:hypothetical protein
MYHQPHNLRIPIAQGIGFISLPCRVPHISILRCGHRAKHDRSAQMVRIGFASSRQLGRSVTGFACACLDWSEIRPHIGGALGAALLKIALKKRWVMQDLDSRALAITAFGRREMLNRFDLKL